MPKSTRTKCLIAKGVKKLLETVSFGEISVGEICKQCQISRNTFYYHFKDKFDVIHWIFYTEITPILEESFSINHWEEGLLALCHYMQENRKFYVNILRFHGQNSFIECLMEFYENLGKENACGIQSIQKIFSTGIKMDFKVLCLWTDRRGFGLGKERYGKRPYAYGENGEQSVFRGTVCKGDGSGKSERKINPLVLFPISIP